MIDADLRRLEGVWIGTEQVRDGDGDYDGSGRLVFQMLFDGRFLLCDHIQTAHERPTMYAHGVFRRDERTNALCVTWFRSSTPAPHQQADAVAEGDALVFVANDEGRRTRTIYRVLMDRLSMHTDREDADGEWKRMFEGAYRRR